jgi:hypothetical protein
MAAVVVESRAMPAQDATLDASSWTRRHAWAFAATVTALGAVPFTVAHWPSQDGPNHLAVAHVLGHYADPGSPFPAYFAVEPGVKPSGAVYAALTLLGRVVSLGTAEKLLVALALVLVPLSLFVLVRRALPERTGNVLLGLPFVLGWAFAMGFLSFQLGMALGVLAVGLAWVPDDARAAPPLGARHAGAAALFLLSVWCHPVAALLAGLVLALLEWRNAARPAHWPRLLLVVGPGLAFLVGSYLAAAPAAASATPAETYFSDPVSILGAMFEYNIAYTPLELGPRLVALGLLLPFAARALRASPPLRAGARAAVGRVVVAMLLLYCAMPGAVGGWFFASTRFFLFAALLLPAAAELPAWVARRAWVLAPALTGALLALQWPVMHRASRQMQDVLDAGAALPRGPKLIPVDFNVSVLGPQPTGDAWAQLVGERDVLASQVLAAGKPRMGGERFRTLSYRDGVLDRAGGTLPWSDFEMWNDVARQCAAPGSPVHWFVHVSGECSALLAARKAAMEQVIDRYDYVLMLDPPEYGRELVAARLHLVKQVGSAWLYAVAKQEAHQEAPRAPPR